jgi:hypothetical protein
MRASLMSPGGVDCRMKTGASRQLAGPHGSRDWQSRARFARTILVSDGLSDRDRSFLVRVLQDQYLGQLYPESCRMLAGTGSLRACKCASGGSCQDKKKEKIPRRLGKSYLSATRFASCGWLFPVSSFMLLVAMMRGVATLHGESRSIEKSTPEKEACSRDRLARP